MKYGIIGALDEEVALLTAAMESPRETTACGCVFHEGKLDGHDAVVVCCSVGKINAAVCTTILIREFGCGAVVNAGVAGAMGKGLGPLDIVLSSDVVLHDADAIMEKYYPFSLTFAADDALLAAAKESCREEKGDSGWAVGRIATGDQFVAGGALHDSIKERFAPLAVEMEGGAVAQASYMNGVPFLIIRTMSDSADDDADVSYDNFMERAAQQSAAIVRGMLRHLPA
jgi:adenosylhomocysteine nucleosidase